MNRILRDSDEKLSYRNADGYADPTCFYAVDHWNDFFSAIMYITNQKSWPLQLFLRSMLYENEAAYQSGGESLYLLGQPMKMAAVMLAIIPIMCAYPFFQKYFTKGVMTGALKG